MKAWAVGLVSGAVGYCAGCWVGYENGMVDGLPAATGVNGGVNNKEVLRDVVVIMGRLAWYVMIHPLKTLFGIVHFAAETLDEPEISDTVEGYRGTPGPEVKRWSWRKMRRMPGRWLTVSIGHGLTGYEVKWFIWNFDLPKEML